MGGKDVTTRQEVERLAREAADKAERAVERGNYEVARKLFDTAKRFAAHAREMGTDAPLGAAYTNRPTGPGAGLEWAAPNGEEQR